MSFTSQFSEVSESVVQVVAGVLQGNTLDVVTRGTGTIINDGSMVLTCAHCVNKEMTNAIKVNNSPSFIPCASLIQDPNSKLDIAIIKFNQKIGKPVQFLSQTSCSKIQIGNDAFVVGYPMYCKDQVLFPSTIASISDASIRIASNINHGNSGGPLFDINGKQIGVVNAKHGKLSGLLENFTQLQVPRMTINNVNTWAVLQQLIREMEYNLNLGIGYAIPIHQIRTVSSVFNQYLS